MTDFQAAEIGVWQLYARYGDALWRNDAEAFVACFAADAVWKIGGRTVRGRAEIDRLFTSYMETAEKIMMFSGIPLVNVAGGTATGRIQATEYIKRKDGQAIRTLGIYYDRFVRQDEHWLFQWHHFNLYYYGPPDFSEPYYECREYGPPPGMPGPDDPTTVRRGA